MTYVDFYLQELTCYVLDPSRGSRTESVPDTDSFALHQARLEKLVGDMTDKIHKNYPDQAQEKIMKSMVRQVVAEQRRGTHQPCVNIGLV